jgi:hypothetical protein
MANKKILVNKGLENQKYLFEKKSNHRTFQNFIRKAPKKSGYS